MAPPRPSADARIPSGPRPPRPSMDEATSRVMNKGPMTACWSSSKLVEPPNDVLEAGRWSLRRPARPVDSAFRARAGASGGRFQQLRHADQVVGGGGELGPELVSSHPDVAQLPATSHGLHPAEDLFHPFARTLGHRVAGMTNRAPVQGAPAHSGDVLCHLRRDIQLTAVLYEPSGVVGLVSSDGPPSLAADMSAALQHARRGVPLREPRRLVNGDVDDQPVAVLHENVAAEAE